MDITELCNQAKEYEFASVCVNPSYVKLAKSYLQVLEYQFVLL